MADDKVYSRGDLIPPMYGDLEQALSDLDFIPIEGYVDFDEIAEPSNPDANKLRLWAEALGGFGQLHFKDSNGLDYQLGRDNIHTVRNNTGATITKGSCVYISGSTGAFPEVSLAKADSESTMPAMGVVVADISDNSFGQVMVQGDIQGIDTSSFTNGDILYVSEATAGVITATKPAGANHIQRVGIVVNSGVGNGVIAVLITTADQTDAEIETAYNNQVDIVTQAEAEAGTSTTVRRWNALRVKQAIDALASGGIENVVEDTTPQLGGDLDGQDLYRITGIDNLVINGEHGETSRSINFSVNDNDGNLRTELEGTGVQAWYLNNTSAEAGSINYSTPGGNVGIYFLDESGLGRSQVRLIDGGGLAFGARTGSSGPPDQVRINTDGYLGIAGSYSTYNPTTAIDMGGALTLRKLSADPPDPSGSGSTMWRSDGTGTGDDGDVLMKSTVGATTKTKTLLDYSAL